MSRTGLALRQMLKGRSSRGSRGNTPPGSENEVNFATGQNVTFALTKLDDLVRLDDNEGPPEHTIATFRSNGRSVVLCPLASVSIELPSHPSTSELVEKETLDIPASSEVQTNFVYLRVGDTVDFPGHNCKIMLLVQDTGASSASARPLDVQVKSSDVDQDDNNGVGDELTEDEDDLNMGHVRITTPLANDERQAPAIEETPQGRPLTAGTDAVYSTAQVEQQDELPSTQDVAPEDEASPSTSDEDPLGDSPLHKANAGAVTNSAAERLASTPPQPVLSSADLDERSAASSAAERSMRSSKRSLPDDEEDAVPSKKSKKAKPAVYKSARKTGRNSTEFKSSPRVEIPPASASSAASTAPAKVLLSSSKHAEKARLWLKGYNITVIEDVPTRKADFICVVGKGELPKTAKVLRSLVLGKAVVTDDWITESMKAAHVLPATDYVHDDLTETTEIDRSKLFSNKVIFLTQPLHKQYGESGFASLRALLTEAGATRVETGTPRKGLDRKGNVIFIGCEGKDQDVSELMNGGKNVFKKDLVSQSIIRGELLLDGNVFKIDGESVKAAPKKGRKK
ncbi:hypothetical protein B0A48_04369 [Cryoendolithus antarcticus]|uniref:BRCT domain-containing protein n=1 Tax=Cryoendolithus antarcticus TaxID=1507870 RepID=A0A1V8TFF9_9PEZI|nr:hypothetical protein B0A48_04369 [Cryoendolithus antarcticus]